MGRLDDIIDRNKHPRKHSKMRFPLGLMLSAFVLLILVLMIFTDLEDDPKPIAPAATPSGEKRVDGVLLYRERTHRDAATHD
ncbi:MAG TPA: hypothetical protein VIV40_20195 [Kofleriaceae bacterium]